jgi:hypothetical protein
MSELGKKGNLCIPVGGEREDRDDPYFDGGKVTINKFRFVGELEDDPVIRPQAQIDQMKREPIYLFSHLSVRDIASPVGKRDSITVAAHPFVKFFPECLIDPISLYFFTKDSGNGTKPSNMT